MRQLRDGREQLGGRRHRAGGTGGDHRRVAPGQPFGLGLDQAVAPLGRFDGAALVAQRRPRLARDLEETQRFLPELIEIVRHQAVESVPAHLPRGHVVHQAGEIVGQAEGGRWRVGDQGRALRAAHLRRIRPFQDQFGQQQPALQRLDRLRQSQRLRRQFAGGGFGEGDLVLVEIADGDDARQDGGVAVEAFQEYLARQPAGTPGRQIERGAGQLERLAAGRKAGHQSAGAQGVDQHRQKRRRGGDVEDVGLGGRH